MKPCIICSNMLNERANLPEWFNFVQRLADGIIIVDSGSTDGTVEYAKEQGAIVIQNNTIQEQGYGPARTELRNLARRYFPHAGWMCYFDGDERVMEEDFHTFRFLRDNLTESHDVIAFPRIDWVEFGNGCGKMAKDWVAYPDYQGRMTRLASPITYVRRLHEQIQNCRGIFAHIENPKIHHFHRQAGPEVRDRVGKLCAKLHMEDKEWGHTYPMHHKEAEYRKRYLAEGL